MLKFLSILLAAAVLAAPGLCPPQKSPRSGRQQSVCAVSSGMPDLPKRSGVYQRTLSDPPGCCPGLIWKPKKGARC